MHSRPSEAAEAIAQIVPALSEADAHDLKCLVARLISVPNPSLLRAARLGLLVEILDGLGSFPDSTQYDERRRERVAGGESWPDHATLCRAYGSWLKAVVAAMAQLHTYGRPPSYQRYGSSDAYSTLEMLEAIRECRTMLAPWPSEADWPRGNEYRQYRQISREAARRLGSPQPRVPSLTALRKRFGSWDQAVQQAQAARDIG